MVRKLFLPRVRRAASTRPVAADVDPVPSFNDTSDQRVRPSLILSEIQQRSPKRDHDPRFHLSPCPPSTRNCPDAPPYCAAFTVLRPPLSRDRTRATWPDGAGPTESAVQHGLRISVSGETRAISSVGFERRYPPPDHVRALDHGGGWRPPHGEALPRLLVTSQAQVCAFVTATFTLHVRCFVKWPPTLLQKAVSHVAWLPADLSSTRKRALGVG